MSIENRLKELGLVLPSKPRIPPGVVLPFERVRVCGNRALISGHGPTNLDGSFAAPLGRVGTEVTKEDAYRAARLTGLSILASLQGRLGSLDRIACWVRAFGMVLRHASGDKRLLRSHPRNFRTGKRPALPVCCRRGGTPIQYSG